MKKLILLIAVLLLIDISAKAEWDLSLNRTVTGRTNMRLLTVPFEGLNRYNTNPNGNNRISWIFNGPIHRRFLSQSGYVDKPILVFSSTNALSYLASCFAEVVSTGKEVYGFGKYLIEFENFNNPAKNISFIFNTLDSRAGMDNVLNGRGYHSDWSMIYYETSNSAYVIIDNGDNSSYRFIDTVFLGQTNREINYWYAYWRTNAPLEKNFYARTTPFPMNPYLVNDTNKLYNIKIGTKITFDTVYHNFGVTDRWGYNTVETNGPYDYYNSPPVPDFDSSQKGSVFTTPKYFYYTNDPSGLTLGMKITAEYSDTIIIKKNKILYINGYDFHYGGDTLLLKQGSTTIKEEGTRLNAYNGGIIIDEGCNSIWSSNSMHRIYNYSKLLYTGISHLINNGGRIDVDNLAELHLGNNTVVTFDGSNTLLKLKPGSKVFFGQNAKIIFKNGAYLDADGATFAGINGSIWQGIEFEYAGSSSIKNCIFNNAMTCLNFKCDPANNNTGPLILDNIFNVAADQGSTYKYGIYSVDMNLATIGNNHFNLPSAYNAYGMLMKSSASNITSAGGSSAYKLILYNNYFDGGKIGMVLMSYASVSKPYLLYQNYYNYGTGNIADYGIAGRNISGKLENSQFFKDKTNGDITVAQSNLVMTNNNFGAVYNNINATANSVIDLASTISNNDIIFTGGNNIFNSSSSDNIVLGSYATFYINNGFNCFLTKGPGKLHMMGMLNISDTTYDAYNNFWGSQYPEYYLLNNQDPPRDITLNYSQLPGCQTSALSIYQVIDLGNGLMDTIYKTANNANIIVPPDEALYNQAAAYLGNANYPTAILNFKTLINNYTESTLLTGALYDLNSSYQGLDTSSDQGYRDLLYSDLKTYLTAKINSYLYNAEFNDVAYNMTLSCDANMANYNDAMLGYQFIAMYHPDAATRLMAGWDYAEIEALLNGFGGGETSNMAEDKYILKAYRILEGKITKDSVMKRLKNQYNKLSAQKDSRIKDELGSIDMNARSKAFELKEKENRLIKKAINVMMTARNLSSAEKTEHQIEDILLTSGNERKSENPGNNPELMSEYTLSQNYPNPFNPVTKINYALPKQGFVTLKIYDITGREIQTLVNEVKQPGYYSVDFNGSALASGVYFYRIQCGTFISVKKMVLVK